MAQDSIAQEAKMDMKIASWKEVLELYYSELIKDYPEGLWVDSGEVDYDSKESWGSESSSLYGLKPPIL